MLKRFVLLFVVAFFAMSIAAQCRMGYLTRRYPDNRIDYRAGEEVYYKPAGKGKIRVFIVSEWDKPISESYVKFSGFYAGITTDPVDDYVNVRKGPGTNYPVVTTLNVPEPILYKKTGNWVKVYYSPKKFMGYVFHDRIDSSMPIP